MENIKNIYVSTLEYLEWSDLWANWKKDNPEYSFSEIFREVWKKPADDGCVCHEKDTRIYKEDLDFAKKELDAAALWQEYLKVRWVEAVEKRAAVYLKKWNYIMHFDQYKYLKSSQWEYRERVALHVASDMKQLKSIDVANITLPYDRLTDEDFSVAHVRIAAIEAIEKQVKLVLEKYICDKDYIGLSVKFQTSGKLKKSREERATYCVG